MDSEEKYLISPSNINYKKEIFASEPCFTIMLLLYLNTRIGFTELYKLLNITPGNLDHHIKKLKREDCVRTRKIITWRPLTIIEITNKGSKSFKAYAMKIKEILNLIS